MNAQAGFSLLYLAIVAAAGLTLAVDGAWKWAAVTAAIAFFAEEAKALERHWKVLRWNSDGYGSDEPTARSEMARYCALVLVLMSWAAGVNAGVSLL